MQYPEDMDHECVPLCDALNALPGVRTVESCCGHIDQPFRVWFRVEQGAEDAFLPLLVRSLGSGWLLKKNAGCYERTHMDFMLEGPKGFFGYGQAALLADRLQGRGKAAKDESYREIVERGVQVHLGPEIQAERPVRACARCGGEFLRGTAFLHDKKSYCHACIRKVDPDASLSRSC